MKEVSAVKMLSISAAAERLSIAEKTIRDLRWRLKVGLPLIRVGGRVGVLESDIEELLRRGRERLPSQGRREG